MAITVAKQVIVDGSRVVVVKLDLASGAASDVTDQTLLDVSTLEGAPTDVKIMNIKASSEDLDIVLRWNANANVDIVSLPAGENDYCYKHFGGLVNNASTGKNGDILYSTNNAAEGSKATIILELKKR